MLYYRTDERGLKCTSASYSLTTDRWKVAPPFARVLSWHGNAVPRSFSYLLLAEDGTFLLAEVTLAGASVRMEDDFIEILNEGVARLKKLGFDPVAKLVRGQPAEEIGNFAKEIGADLIIVGHRRQSAFDRWWSGPKGAYLMDYTDCSLLVARNAVSDEAIETAFMTSGPDG